MSAVGGLLLALLREAWVALAGALALESWPNPGEPVPKGHRMSLLFP
jgi:hypothetical protein